MSFLLMLNGRLMPDERLALRMLFLTLLANCGLSFMSCAQDVAHRKMDINIKM
jgi:hypothetical protein